MVSRVLIMLPGPTNVPDRVLRAMARPIIGHRGAEFHELYERIEENLKYVFQTQKEVYLLTSSGTGAVECAVGNLVSPGDKVLVPVFGVFSERLSEKVLRHGGRLVKLAVEWGEAPTASQVEEALEREGDVKAVAIVYNETSTGITVRDLPKIAEAAKSHGAYTIVDAISILGGEQLPVDRWGIDLCVTGSQKCLACPPGLAFISVSDEAWREIERNPRRPYYFDLVSFRRFHERRETPFTPAVPLLFALDEALQMIREEGLEQRFRRHASCAEAFYAGLTALGMQIYPKQEAYRSNTVIAVELPEGVDDVKLRSLMKSRYGVQIAGGMGKLKGRIIRIGCMGIISEVETLTTISALENALLDMGHKIEQGAGVNAAKNAFKS